MLVLNFKKNNDFFLFKKYYIIHLHSSVFDVLLHLKISYAALLAQLLQLSSFFLRDHEFYLLFDLLKSDAKILLTLCQLMVMTMMMMMMKMMMKMMMTTTMMQVLKVSLQHRVRVNAIKNFF